jgi:hypothetical protein
MRYHLCNVSVEVMASVSSNHDVAEDGKSERDSFAELEELGTNVLNAELSYILY